MKPKNQPTNTRPAAPRPNSTNDPQQQLQMASSIVTLPAPRDNQEEEQQQEQQKQQTKTEKNQLRLATPNVTSAPPPQPVVVYQNVADPNDNKNYVSTDDKHRLTLAPGDDSQDLQANTSMEQQPSPTIQHDGHSKNRLTLATAGSGIHSAPPMTDPIQNQERQPTVAGAFGFSGGRQVALVKGSLTQHPENQDLVSGVVDAPFQPAPLEFDPQPEFEPQPETPKPVEPKNRLSSTLKKVFIIACCVVVIVIVIVVVLVVTGDDTGDDGDEDGDDKGDLRQRKMDIKTHVLDNKWSLPESFNDDNMDSAQVRAVAWLAESIPTTTNIVDIDQYYYILAVLYHTLNGPRWTYLTDETETNKSKWLDTNVHVCQWKYVSCDQDDNVIVGLQVDPNLNAVEVTLPYHELLQLSSLQILEIPSNFVASTLPTNSFWSELTSLDLSDNKLTGAIPDSLFTATNLQYLKLGKNELSGSLSPNIGDLTKLDTILLESNDLNGTIPIEFQNLSALKILALDDNRSLSGHLNDWLTSLTQLEYLSLSMLRRLEGSIPTGIHRLSNLVEFDCKGTDLQGTIPTEIGRLSLLELFEFDYTEISGSLPTEIGKLERLVLIQIPSTMITGPIPTEIGNLAQLVKFSLQSTDLSGTLPTEFGKLSNLGTITIDGNGLYGKIPSEIGQLTNLESIALGSGAFDTAIPPEVCNLSNLRVICTSTIFDCDCQRLCGLSVDCN